MFKKGLGLIILIFSLSASQMMFAQVMSLREIDTLIKDTDYDRALAELHKYIEANPENFDNAQTRITKIMNARKRYSELALELVRMIMDDPTNSEQIYKITYELEHLEKHPTDKQLEFIRETRIAAEFSYFRGEFARIQQETEELIERGEYVAASAKAHEGFYLYQETFFDTWKQDEIVKPVNSALASIDANLVQFNEIQKRLNDCVGDFVRAVNSERQEDIRKTYQTVNTVFEDFAKIRNKIYESGEVFRSIFKRTVTMYGAEDSDASFLPFVQRFTLGLSDNSKTGIAGAIDSEWNSLCDRMKDAVWSKLDKYVADTEKSIPDKLFYDDSTRVALRTDLLPTIKQYSDLSLNVNSLYSKLTPALNEDAVHFYDVASVFPYDILVHIESLFADKENFENQINAIAKVVPPENPPVAELNNSDYTKNLLAVINSVDLSGERKAEVDLESDDWSKEYIALDTTNKRENLQTLYTGFVGEMNERSYGAVISGYEELCRYLNLCDDEYVEITKADYENAMLNYNGIQNIILEKYPDKSLQMSLNIQEQIDNQVEVINKHIALVEAEVQPEIYKSTITNLTNDRELLMALRLRSSDLAALSRTQIQKSEIAKNEAVLRYEQAETALREYNFDTARRRLQDSRTKYNESLEILFSSSLQTSSDIRLQSLGERINQLENEIVVRDVRDLKTRAKNEYYSGNFEEAETLLTQAKNRWAVTNVDEDLEITNLLAIVNTALSMKVGRVLLPSAALYPEMSQILSIAAQYYTEGSVLLERNRRSEGEEILNSALQKLQELQLVYPLNQEAALLTLRIQKVLNPNEFDLMFDRKVAEARVNYRVRDLQQQAYTDLLDLYEINPKYPGLKDLIYNVELEIGIRQKPVDNSAAIRSASLTREAQTMINEAGRDEAKLRQALTKLDEAISLNGNNNDAIRLKDQIQTSIGGKAAVVLSSEDEIKYQQAIQELQKNNLITANALVEQLLQKQSNRNSSKILELQKKIKALL